MRNQVYQPGEADFRSVLPEDIDWKPFSGLSTLRGPYVLRVKVPSGVKLMPHKHPGNRILPSENEAYCRAER